MKPTKNIVFCKDCGRTKMLFETEKKAVNFIKFNNEEIEAQSGYSPQRSYYCLFCGGWHITSIKEKIGFSKKEQLVEQYKLEKEKKKATKIVNQEEIKTKKYSIFENQIKEMEPAQKENFFLENIHILNEEIKLLPYSKSRTYKKKLKELRQNLQILYIVIKQNGFQKIESKFKEAREKEIKEEREKEIKEAREKEIKDAREKEIEEWRLWTKTKGY